MARHWRIRAPLPNSTGAQAGTDLSLAEVALHAGFSDQSQFCHHFKRLIGVTPGQFRTPARIAYYPGNKEGHIPTRSASEGPMKSSESRRGSPWDD